MPRERHGELSAPTRELQHRARMTLGQRRVVGEVALWVEEGVVDLRMVVEHGARSALGRSRSRRTIVIVHQELRALHGEDRNADRRKGLGRIPAIEAQEDR
jgi:hypothetical protein